MIEYQSDQDVYIGYYIQSDCQRRLIAISKQKDILKTYLEYHRNLTPREYDIEYKVISESDLLLKYEDFIISEYYGYYIPEIDQTIIEIYSEEIEMELQNTIESLKRLSLLSIDIKKIPKDDVASLLNALKVLNKFQKSDKLMKKLNTKAIHSDPFLFCDITEYLRQVSSYKEIKYLDKRYQYVLYE